LKGGGSRKKLGYADALINVRNRFAHSRRLPEERSRELYEDHYEIWKALILKIFPIFRIRVLIYDKGQQKYESLDGLPLDPRQIPSADETPLLLWHDEKQQALTLYPLVILFSEPSLSDEDVLFLEEMKGKNLLYLYRDQFIKRKEEFSTLVQMLDKRMVRVEDIDSGDLSLAILGERIDRITGRTLVEFEDAQKYIPTMFVPRPSLDEELDSWVNQAQPAVIVVGDPGVGKTSLVAHWASRRREQGDHVLLVEAARLSYSDLSAELEDMLYLGSPLKECLDMVHQQIRAKKKGVRKQAFIFIIDGINEFVGEGLDNRTLLWREINILAERLSDYRPFFKCLVTTRSDTWNSDFTNKRTADTVLKRRHFYPSKNQDFPCLVVSTLTESEAMAIYENARSEVPGMAPRTPWHSLVGNTKKMIRNPFILRLLLRTFHDEEVPLISKRRLLRRYSREKALQETEKREVLFRLLERMADLRKTEISLEELLAEKKGNKGREKTKRRKRTRLLDEIVYDPHPQSHYRKLIDEGIIEERLVGQGEQAEERVAFAQEKLSQLVDHELKTRKIQKTLKLSLITCFIIIFIGTIVHYKLTLSFSDSFQKFISNDVLSSLNASEINELHTLLKQSDRAYNLSISVLITIQFTIILLALVSGPLITIPCERIAHRLMPLDVPLKYLQEKYIKLLEKHLFPWTIAFLIPVLSAVFIYSITSTGHNPTGFYWILMSLIIAVNLILAGITSVMRNGQVPEDAFVLFGFSSFLRMLPKRMVLLVLIMITGLFSMLGDPLQVQINNVIEKSELVWERELKTSSVYQSLQKSNQPEDEQILDVLTSYINNGLEFKTSSIGAFLENWDYFFTSIFVALIITIPIFFLLQVILGRPLSWYLQRKNDKGHILNSE